MSTIDVTLSTLSTEYPVLTKAGNIWPKRINWTHIEVKGNIIATHFGTFTFIKAERINKVWFWTLEDENGQLIKIKRDQVRKNKRLPRNAEILNKIKLPKITYQLCLPPAREYIDLLVEEANRLGEKRNQRILNNPKCFDKKGKLKKHIRLTKSLDYISSTFREKFFFAHGLFLDFYEIEEINRIFKKLLASVHPDKTHQNTNEDFLLVMEWCNFN